MLHVRLFGPEAVSGSGLSREMISKQKRLCSKSGTAYNLFIEDEYGSQFSSYRGLVTKPSLNAMADALYAPPPGNCAAFADVALLAKELQECLTRDHVQVSGHFVEEQQLRRPKKFEE